MKFGRRGELKVEINPRAAADNTLQGSNTLTIPEDITIEFEVSRAFISSSQEATFRVLNLREAERNLLQKDPYALTEFRAIQFRAGYEQFPLALVFNGFVRSATSWRRSATEMVTEITAYDGGLAMANGWTAQTLAAGNTTNQVVTALAKLLPRMTGSPIVGDFPTKNLRAKVLFGNTWSLILSETGNLATIDNGQVKALNLDEAIDAPVQVIESDSGLLGSPRRTPTKIEFDMIFEPRLTIGQIVELRSIVNRALNGVYKVTGLSHRGTISPVVSGECKTSVSLFFGPGELKLVSGNLLQ